MPATEQYYLQEVQADLRKRCCPRCGQALPAKDKYGVKVMSEGVEYRGVFVKLPLYKRQILELLVRNAPELVAKQRIYQRIYDGSRNELPDPKVIDVHMMQLRKLLEPTGLVIETVWGHGYKIPKPEPVPAS